MNDPLYKMEPTDEAWPSTLADEVDDLHTALCQMDGERAARKIAELRDAFARMAAPTVDDQRAVRCEWVSIGTTEGNNVAMCVPPPEWNVVDVLPAFASNGAGVVFVQRRRFADKTYDRGPR